MSIFADGKNGGRSANPTTELIDTSKRPGEIRASARDDLGKYQIRLGGPRLEGGRIKF